MPEYGKAGASSSKTIPMGANGSVDSGLEVELLVASSSSSTSAAATDEATRVDVSSVIEDLLRGIEQTGEAEVSSRVDGSSRADGAVRAEAVSCEERAVQAGAVLSLDAPATQVAGGKRPAGPALEQESVDAMAASGLADSSEDEAPRAKRRRLRRIEEEETKGEAESGDECVVMRIVGRRGTGGSLQYLAEWEDQSSEWKAVEDMKNCRELVIAYDRYLKEHPTRNVPYAQFVSSDIPSIRLMAANSRDDCALHAVQMAFELMGGLGSAVAEIERRSTAFLQRMTDTDSKRFGGLKFSQLVKFLREEVPATGWALWLDRFEKNWFKGDGTGALAVAKLAWRDQDPLEEGVYLVHVRKPSQRGHCIAMQYANRKMVVREEGITSGIMDHKEWMRDIIFVRRVVLRLA